MAPTTTTTTTTTKTTTNGTAAAASNATAKPLKRFELRGFERVSTLTDKGSYKVAHVMVVRGQLDELLRHIPAALVLTFNKHPRMRAKQVKGEFAVAEVQPPIVLEHLVKARLLGIRGTSKEEERLGKWQKHVEEESNLPFDRYCQYPFFLRVWVDKASNTARLILFSDKFVSDGMSGTVVLHDLLSFASALSLESPSLEKDKKELPLRDSLYNMWLDGIVGSSWTRFWVKFFASSGFKRELKTFKPLLTPRADQHNMTVPVECNPTSVLFADGASENLKKLQAACDREGVKLQSALAVAVLLGYYATQPPKTAAAQPEHEPEAATANGDAKKPAAKDAKSKSKSKKTTKPEPFKLRVETLIDMRRRVDYPVQEVQIGDYTTSYPIESFAHTGVALERVKFWDLARANKQELDALLQSYALPKPLIFADQSLNERTPLPFFEQVPIPHATTADVTLANLGSYIHARTHDFRTVDPKTKGPSTGKLVVESVTFSSTAPHLSSAASLFVSSVSALSYGFAHKLEDKVGRTLLANLVAVIESIGNVAADELLSDVVAKARTQQLEVSAKAAEHKTSTTTTTTVTKTVEHSASAGAAVATTA